MTTNSEFIVTILGSGTSTGVPMAGCSCTVCTSSDPHNQRLRTSALLSYRGKNILIDAGPDFRQQALRESIPSIDAIFFTHAHSDHILGIDDLRPYFFEQKTPIPCFGYTETLDQIKQMFFYVFDRDPNYQGGGLVELSLMPIEDRKAIEIFGLTITPFTLNHGHMRVAGLRCGDIAYATDCSTIPESSKALIQGVPHLIIDGLRNQEHPTHMTIPQAIEVSGELDAGQSYLIHMNHTVDHQLVSAQLPANVSLCYDGMKIISKYSQFVL